MQTKETKKTRSVTPLAGALALALILLAALQLVLAPAPAAVAAPPAAPTPVASIPGDSDNSLYINFQSATVIAADTNTTGRLVQGYEYIDFQITTDQTVVGTETNTTTFSVEFSNDNSNWDTGPAILSANAADATEITRIMTFGRYVRVKQDVTNTNNVTVTILGLAK
jgi:hypothetical protein